LLAASAAAAPSPNVSGAAEISAVASGADCPCFDTEIRHGFQPWGIFQGVFPAIDRWSIWFWFRGDETRHVCIPTLWPPAPRHLPPIGVLGGGAATPLAAAARRTLFLSFNTDISIILKIVLSLFHIIYSLPLSRWQRYSLLAARLVP
jgi:hypothetical protein